MTSPAPSTLQTIRNKVRRITGRPSDTSITNAQINEYINTFYLYDFPEHLRLQNLRVNWQFLTQANIPVYDFPKDLFLTVMPPIYIAGYQSYLTQSRQNFFRINPELNYLQQSVATGTGAIGTVYSIQLSNGNILRGFKQNPPGAYADYSSFSPIPVNPGDPDFPFYSKNLIWNVMLSGTDNLGRSVSIVDDGLGNLWSPDQKIYSNSVPLGTVNYITGAITTKFPVAIGLGNAINAQYVPFVASRPMSACFYQDQISVYPIPDQAYTISFECYKYPSALLQDADSPQLAEWWQALAYGAAQKIFEDNGDMENVAKYRPLLDEQLRLIQRRTLVQQTSERTSTIYAEQQQVQQFPFGNMFSF